MKKNWMVAAVAASFFYVKIWIWKFRMNVEGMTFMRYNKIMKDIKLTQNDLELVLVALSKMDEDREKYVEVYNEIISQLKGEDIID